MAAEGYRRDIDGLRAVAILAVVAFHAGVPGFAAGFAGVDIFFVISGYLITRILTDEQAASGRIDALAFYARRIRRLAPAFGLMLAGVLLTGFFLLLPTGEQKSLGIAGLSAATFLSNFYFWTRTTGYFADSADTMPLLHTWTLSVEEQFYLVWPFCLMGLAWIAARRGSPRFSTPTLLAAVIAGGLGLNLALGSQHLESVFYFTPLRVWQFALGGLVATLPLATRPGSGWGAGLQIAGLALIVGTAPFGDLKLLVMICWAFGAAALILGGRAAAASPVSRALGGSVVVGIGRLSYSWYLFHWPMLAFAQIVTLGEVSLMRDLALCGTALGLAALSYRFVEQPARRGRFPGFSTQRGAFITGGIILGVCAVLAAGLWAWGLRPISEPRLIAARDVQNVRLGPDCDNRTRPVGGYPLCVLGDAQAPAGLVLMGDSHARHLGLAVDRLGKDHRLKTIMFYRPNCRPEVLDPDTGSPDCNPFYSDVTRVLPRMKAEQGVTGVILSAAWDPQTDLRVTEALIRNIRAQGLRVILVGDGPVFPYMVKDCHARRAPGGCNLDRETAQAVGASALALFHKLAAADPEIRVVSMLDVLCGQTSCPGERNGVILYSDYGHLSDAGSLGVAPALRPLFLWAAGKD